MSEAMHGAGAEIAIAIRGLRKVFDTPDGEKVAVRNLHVNIYANQIFALLGHNGAGKTTSTRAMLPLSMWYAWSR